MNYVEIAPGVKIDFDKMLGITDGIVHMSDGTVILLVETEEGE